MKKKTTKQKRATKVKNETLHVPFDLNIDTKEKADNLVAHLIQLQGNAGWMIITKIIEGNIAEAEKQIIAKMSLEGTPLTDAQVDDLRKVRNVMEQLIKKPQEIIDKFRAQEGVKIPKYDPYATDMVQFRRNVDHEFASSLKE
jgi:hypothetical protein